MSDTKLLSGTKGARAASTTFLLGIVLLVLSACRATSSGSEPVTLRIAATAPQPAHAETAQERLIESEHTEADTDDEPSPEPSHAEGASDEAEPDESAPEETTPLQEPDDAPMPLSPERMRKLKKAMIQASIDEYQGSCPCPYNTARNGSRCGRRSAYDRPGGESPLCFERDITDDMVREFLRNQPATGD